VIPGEFAIAVWLLLPPIFFYLLRPHVAALVTLLSATMFLPELVTFNLPVLPPMGKDELASTVCMACCAAAAGSRLVRARPFAGPELLMLILAFSTMVTTLLNRDVIRYGNFAEPGVEVTAVVAAVLFDWMTWGFPFLVGRALFTGSRELRDLFIVLVFAGIVYSLLMVLELRLSPQLHRWVYGYHQHSFAQQLRGDGVVRPMVFMRHGLNVVMFAVIFVSAAWVLFKTRVKIPRLDFVPKIAIATFLLLVLLLCRSSGATLYILALVGLIVFAPIRLQVVAAVGIAAVALLYPAIRSAQLLPVDDLLELAEEQFGEERAQSMGGRLKTEEQMMGRVQERLWFGWASVGRPMFRDEVTGELQTTYDGVWLIEILKGGLIGFACVFGLLLLPVFQTALRIGALRASDGRIMVAGLSLMVAIRVFDLIPNSTSEPYLTLLSGALAGTLPGMLREQRSPGASPPGPGTGGAIPPPSAGAVIPTREASRSLGQGLLRPPRSARPRRRPRGDSEE